MKQRKWMPAVYQPSPWYETIATAWSVPAISFCAWHSALSNKKYDIFWGNPGTLRKWKHLNFNTCINTFEPLLTTPLTWRYVDSHSWAYKVIFGDISPARIFTSLLFSPFGCASRSKWLNPGEHNSLQQILDQGRRPCEWPVGLGLGAGASGPPGAMAAWNWFLNPWLFWSPKFHHWSKLSMSLDSHFTIGFPRWQPRHILASAKSRQTTDFCIYLMMAMLHMLSSEVLKFWTDLLFGWRQTGLRDFVYGGIMGNRLKLVTCEKKHEYSKTIPLQSFQPGKLQINYPKLWCSSES